MGIGNVGDPSTLAWLFCDIQPFGKVIIRKGNRPELPIDKPPIWVFCPLLKSKFPRDRRLVEACQKCKHYKGVSHSLKMGSQANVNPSWRPTMIKPEKRKPKISYSKEQIDAEIKAKEEEQKSWEEEEVKLFPKIPQKAKLKKDKKNATKE